MAGRLPMATPPIPEHQQNQPSHAHHSSDPLLHYLHTLNHGFIPTKSTFISAMKACSLISSIPLGKSIHAHLIKSSHQSDRFIATSLIAFYASNNLLGFAHRVFDGIPHRDLPLLTTMLLAYAEGGDIGRARILFDEISDKDVVAWNAMLTGYVRCDLHDDALELFQEMQSSNIEPNEVTLVCALSACSQLGCLALGERIHAYIEMHLDVLHHGLTLHNSLVHVYSKCGKLDVALGLFLSNEAKNLATWNTMLMGFSIHGRGSEAVSLFAQMIKLRVMPDGITFVAVLSACSHAGMVDHARSCFCCMTRLYGIEPEAKHCNCMVDVLCRGGYLKEARMLVERLPFEADARALGALLSGCFSDHDYELGLEVARRLIELEPRDGGRYIALCRLYEIVGKIEEATQLRKAMVEMGIKQSSGMSMIEVDGINHEFIAGDRSHCQSKDVYAMIHCIFQSLDMHSHLN